jgi:hypothetical protein
MANDQTRIVPAHGPVATTSELRAYRDMLADVAGKVKAGIKQGQTVEQVISSHPAEAYRKGTDGEEDRFVEAVYDSLTHEDLHHRL